MDVTKLVLEGGALGALVYFGKLFFNYLGTRSSRADQRESDMIELQRETQKIQSNHMGHSTKAMNDLTQVVGKNTEASEKSIEASEAIVDVVASCALVQKERRKSN